jgi:nicotinamide-nucleotide amidase
MHAATPDSIHEIEAAMRFLLASHQALIITGGLGPTSDDLTRYAVSKVLNQPLVFDEATWQSICDRLTRFGYPTPPESNRQQALFPEKSVIIENPNGTASGCISRMGEQFIFMLPGPPTECLPMLEKIVIPALKEADFQHVSYIKKWLLFGVSEGKIAEELDALAKPYDCVTGYRIWYPYIEFKLHSENAADFETLTALVEKTIQPYLMGSGELTASQLLRKKLMTSGNKLAITDHATGGALEVALKTPQTSDHVEFSNEKKGLLHVEINGLKEFWSQAPGEIKLAHLDMIFTKNNDQERLHAEIPFRGKRVIQYAVEFIACEIMKRFS